MQQQVFGLFDGRLERLVLPSPEALLMSGVHWGKFEHFFTPAYWKAQHWQRRNGFFGRYRIGKTLPEEVAACCLGGHGIPAEVGLAAFAALRDKRVFDMPNVSASDVFDHLSHPIKLGRKTVRYRFARQKAGYLAPILRSLHRDPPEQSDGRKFRDWFLAFKGIGPKTASWITRNWLSSSEVAIIDIHVQRVGVFCGVFTKSHRVERHYWEMETRFLEFAKGMDVSTAALDALIWSQMKVAGRMLNS